MSRNLQHLQLPFQDLSRLRLLRLFAAALLGVHGFAVHAGDAHKGEYLAKAGGCAGCHTDSAAGATAFAGGRLLDTPFGAFYGPNITPHPQAGIGRWTERDFMRAMREGRRPDGTHYYPSFPYPAFTQITDEDLRDLWAYLRSLPPSDRANRPHDLRFPYGWRRLLAGWKLLFFSPGAFEPEPGRSARVNRGAYLTHALGHCGECHTPRNALGAPRRGRTLAGAELPEGRAPNLTPAALKKWNDVELHDFLRTGATPEGDATSDVMYEVIRNTTSQLAPEDLEAMIAYLRALPPLPDERK